MSSLLNLIVQSIKCPSDIILELTLIFSIDKNKFLYSFICFFCVFWKGNVYFDHLVVYLYLYIPEDKWPSTNMRNMFMWRPGCQKNVLCTFCVVYPLGLQIKYTSQAWVFSGEKSRSKFSFQNILWQKKFTISLNIRNIFY